MSKCTIKRNENKEIKSIEVARLHERFNNNAIDIFNRVVDNIAKRLGLSREEYSKRLGIISAQRSVRETIESITNKTMTNYYNEVDTGLIEDDILFQAPVENNKILDFVEGLDPKEDAGLIKALHASPTFLEAMDSVGSNVNTELRQQLNTAQREIQEYFKNKDGKNPRVAELKKQITELKEKIEQSENLSSRITKEEARRLLESDFQSLYDEATTTDKYLIEEYTEEFILGAIDYERNRANNELLAQGWEQVLKSKREGTAYYEQNLASRKEEQRANLVANVKGLKTNNHFPIEFKYLMLDAVLNYYVNPKGYYARRTNSTVSLHNNLSYKVLPSVYEDYLEDSDTNLLMSYYKNKDKEFLTEEQRREVGEKYIVEETDRGYYLKIPQNGTEADVDALYQLTRESHRHPACWCTGAAVATAKGHNNEGDFYLFVDKEFNIKLAFRYSGNSLVEARGLGEGQLILEEDAQDAKYFYDKYPNAKAYEKHYYFNKYYREHIIEKKPIESKELLFSVAKVIFAGDGSYKNSDDKKKALREFVEESIKKDSERLGLKGNEVVFSAKDFTKDTVISFANVIIRADSDSEYKLEYAPFVSHINNHPNKETVTLKFGNIESNNINIDDKIKVVAKSVTATVIDLSKESTIVSDSLSTDFIQLIGKDIRIKTKKANIQNFIVRGYNNIIEGVKYIEKILVEYDRYYTPYHTSADATFIGLEEAGSIEGSGSKIYAPDLKKVDKIFVHDGVFEAEKLRQVNSDFTIESSIVFASKLSEVGGEFNTYSTSGNLSSMEPHLFTSDFRHIKGTYSEYLANGIKEEKEERNRFETLNQDERGAIIKFPLSSIIVLGKNADDTTPLHEIAHEYERVLTNSERKKVLDWAGHKEWTRETSEAFAKGFERYLYEGTEPESIFKQFAEYLKDLIENAVAYFGGINELNEDMKDIYSLMVEQSGEEAAERSFNRIAEPLGNNIYAIENSLDYFNRTISYTSYFTKEEKIGKERTEVQPSFLSKLYDNYSKAIGRTSDYRGRVVQHIDRGAGQVYKPFENDSSSLVGFLTELDDTNSAFIVSHFAPSSLRSGVKLLNQALNEETPFVFAVPTYQADQLHKMGYHYATTTEQYFNGEMVEKHVFTNKDLELEENKYLNEYIEEYIEENSYNQGPLNFMLLGEKGASNLPEDRQLTRNLVQYLNENTSNNISILTTEEIKKDLEKRTGTKELTNTEGTIYGYHDPNTGEIILNSDVLNSRTLFHELTHANEKLIKTAAQNGDTKAQAILEKREDILKESGFDENKARQDYREAKEKTNDNINYSQTTSEKEAIIKEAKANGTYMKAPNGNDTNLNEEQWVTVRTKAFKDWFGDWQNTPENASKVVDENGEPLVVYHGTENRVDKDGNISREPNSDKFYTFDSSKEGYVRGRSSLGHFFTSNRDLAYNYAEWSPYGYIHEVFLNLRNITEIDAKGRYYYDIGEGYNTDTFADKIVDSNLDGGFIRNVVDLNFMGKEEQGKPSDLYIATNPNQIKSATDNVGTFSSDNNDIRYQKESAYLPRPNETEDEYVERMKSEHFATLMEEARLDPAKVSKSLYDKIVDWIKEFYNWVTNSQSFKDLTPGQIINLSLQDFLNASLNSYLKDEFAIVESNAQNKKEEPIIQRQESELAKELIAIPFLTQEEAVSAYANIFNNNFDWRESNCK